MSRQDKSPALTLVGTPLGNLNDLSVRAVQTLFGASVILAEDTRVTRHLMQLVAQRLAPLLADDLQASVLQDRDLRIERFDEHVSADEREVTALVERARAGEMFVLCTDAGMPCISDPGSRLVDAFHQAGFDVDVVPGPTAVSSAVALSGFASDNIMFVGFLPRKREACKEKLLATCIDTGVIVAYESPHRVVDLMGVIAQLMPSARVALCRELTKRYQEVTRERASNLAVALRDRQEAQVIKGECVVVIELVPEVLSEIAGSAVHAGVTENLGAFIDQALIRQEKKSAISKEVAQRFSITKSQAYDLVLARADALDL